MKNEKLKISAGAILLAALLYFLAEPEEILALIVPVLVHEAGHILCLRSYGLKIRGFKAEMKGFCIDYGGYCPVEGHVVSAAAGPAAGIAYAIITSFIGKKTGSEWMNLSSGLSLILSLFNLLPIIPLDGGRIFSFISEQVFGRKRGRQITKTAGIVLSLTLVSFGTWLLTEDFGPAVMLAGVWLTLSQPEGMSRII